MAVGRAESIRKERRQKEGANRRHACACLL
jgi:hypothetical protein